MGQDKHIVKEVEKKKADSALIILIFLARLNGRNDVALSRKCLILERHGIDVLINDVLIIVPIGVVLIIKL